MVWAMMVKGKRYKEPVALAGVTEEQGTISEANNQIKVVWDRGRTSYYHRATPANIELVKVDSE